MSQINLKYVTDLPTDMSKINPQFNPHKPHRLTHRYNTDQPTEMSQIKPNLRLKITLRFTTEYPIYMSQLNLQIHH